MSPNQRLEHVFNTFKLNKKVKSKQEFADKLGYDRSYVSEMLNGRKGITDDFAEKVNKIFNININWLYTGEGEMYDNTTSESDVAYIKVEDTSNSNSLIASLRRTLNNFIAKKLGMDELEQLKEEDKQAYIQTTKLLDELEQKTK